MLHLGIYLDNNIYLKMKIETYGHFSFFFNSMLDVPSLQLYT